MKLLIIVDDLSVSGGTQKTTLKTALGLEKLGYKVRILTSHFNPLECYPEMTKKVHVISLSSDKSKFKNIFKSSNPIAVVLKVILFSFVINIRYLEFDSIVTEDIVGTLSLLYVPKNKQRIIWYLNNQLSNLTYTIFRNKTKTIGTKSPKFIKLLLLKFIKNHYSKAFSKVDRFVTYDMSNLQRLKKLGYKNVSLILPGTDIARYYPKRIDKTRKIRLLSIGTMAPYRRYEDIIEALRIILLSGSKIFVKLTIIGRCDSHKKYYRKLSGLIDKYGLNERVEFVSFVDNRKMESIYKDADIFVFVNNQNTWGLAVAESLMRGLPTIITDNIGISEIVTCKEVYKVKPNSPEQIANTITEIINNPQKTRNKSLVARKKMESMLSWEKFSLKLNALLNK